MTESQLCATLGPMFNFLFYICLASAWATLHKPQTASGPGRAAHLSISGKADLTVGFQYGHMASSIMEWFVRTCVHVTVGGVVVVGVCPKYDMHNAAW